MRNLDCLSFAARRTAFLAILFGSLLPVPPAGANLLPEAALLIHVQPAPPEGEACATTISDCAQIVHTTSAEGRMEFLVFFYSQAYLDYHFPIHHLSATVEWPPDWQLVGWDPCGGGQGTLDLEGWSHPLNLTWPECPQITGSLFLVARLVFEVSGPGMLTFGPDLGVPVWLGCPPDGFDAMARGGYAAAGMECGYSLGICSGNEWCTPVFLLSETLPLTAPVGEVDEEQALYEAVGPSPGPCPFVITPHASWAQATSVLDHGTIFHLVVTANAAGLDEGIHETWIEMQFGLGISRCLKVIFTVTPRTPGSEEPEFPIETRRQSWGQIKDGYRRP